MEVREILRNILDNEKYQKCNKHPIAAVIETADGQYISGWNGPPKRWTGIHDCLRAEYPSGEGMEHCPTVHAEIKAIGSAAEQGISIKDATIYLSEWLSCANCTKTIEAAGITKIVTPDRVYWDKVNHILIPKLQNQPYNFELAEQIIVKSGIELIVDPSIRP
ncbi:MAG: deaminase [Candidatus Woesearchaeota archaeon]